MGLESPMNPVEIPIHPGLRMADLHVLRSAMGAEELKNILRAGNRASRSATPDGIKESAPTHTEDTLKTIPWLAGHVKA